MSHVVQYCGHIWYRVMSKVYIKLWGLHTMVGQESTTGTVQEHGVQLAAAEVEAREVMCNPAWFLALDRNRLENLATLTLGHSTRLQTAI